jgi:hypothetical protein
MESGLELESIVLEKIFGFPRKKQFLPYEGSSYQWYIPSGKPRRTHEIDAKPVPWFSRSMDAVWDVVKKMAELGYWCQMRTPFEKDSVSDNWAGFTPHSTSGWNGKPDHWMCAETMPLAICRAALATMLEAGAAPRK